VLDQKGVEVVLIGESDNVVAEFGKVGQQLEGEVIAVHFTDEDLLEELRLTKTENPIAPLRYGTWA
jgi:Trk K+ transport system NAD-binding subunit